MNGANAISWTMAYFYNLSEFVASWFFKALLTVGFQGQVSEMGARFFSLCV